MWTEEKLNRIMELRSQGVPYKDIALEFQTNKGVISGVISRMAKKGYNVLSINPWTEEEELEFINLRGQNKNNKEIALILGKSHDSVKKKASELLNAGIITGNSRRGWYKDRIKNPPRLNLPEEKLLDIVREYVSSEACPTSYRSNIRRVFGSWTKALEAAGIPGNIGGNFVSSRVTRVYLLRFEGFYKVGVTQQQIKSRFSGAPSYEILDYLETDLDNAVYLEKELKKSIKSYQYVAEHPWFERNGKTECFKTDQPIRQLEDIFDL
jgi:hypothetical protein